MSKDLSHYPKTEQFEVVDTIGVPHPFCITHHHVGWAADRFSGRLGKEAIQALEASKGGRPSCGVPGCNLTFDQHEQALLVRCGVKDDELLRAYLLGIKDQCEKDGYAGFAFLDGTTPEDDGPEAA